MDNDNQWIMMSSYIPRSAPATSGVPQKFPTPDLYYTKKHVSIEMLCAVYLVVAH